MSERTDTERLDWLERRAKMAMLGDTPGYILTFSWDAVDDLADTIDAAMGAEEDEG